MRKNKGPELGRRRTPPGEGTLAHQDGWSAFLRTTGQGWPGPAHRQPGESWLFQDLLLGPHFPIRISWIFKIPRRVLSHCIPNQPPVCSMTPGPLAVWINCLGGGADSGCLSITQHQLGKRRETRHTRLYWTPSKGLSTGKPFLSKSLLLIGLTRDPLWVKKNAQLVRINTGETKREARSLRREGF